jgi:HAD superfamily hydrolase (TIGR01548 family)
MIRRFVLTAGGQPDEVEWWAGDFPVEEVCRRAEGAGLVAVVSPSNPTGAVVSKAAFSELVRRLPTTLILLDQAYVDFCDPEFDLTEIALASPNVVIVRTMSKAAACAGLRVGCAIGDPRVIDWMRRLGLPFPVPTPALEMASKVLAVGPDGARIERVRSQRGALTALLEKLGAEVLPSQASFVFARFDDAVRVWAALGALGISVRRFPGRAGVGEWLRITLPGDEAPWDRLERAFRSILAPEALVFDMDGVLADVSRSYRRAIMETAASWDVKVASADVENANAAGNSNNDWELTRKLLAERGVKVSLDEVTARFEELYQGTDQHPGLRSEETLLLPREVLMQLSQKRPLGVVTGRPRADAERFLAEHGLEDIFRAVVCMEDGPLKPDPAPVRAALERLGVDAAWMVGDTPDDVHAAASAGVLPVGVVAPGDESEKARSTLYAAGAAFVLDAITDLEGVLP